MSYEQTILYNISLRNTGAEAQINLVDVPPLPYVPNSAWGGLWWDAGTQTLQWQGSLERNAGRLFGYRLASPSVCVPPGTIFTNTLTIDDGYHPPFVRSAQVVVDPGPTPGRRARPRQRPRQPLRRCRRVVHRYLPLILRQ